MKRNRFKWPWILILFFSVSAIFNKAFAQQRNVRDGRVKIYYDDKLQILRNTDSLNASYYRIINYRKGNIYGAVTDYYKSGKLLMQGYYAGSTAGKGHENGAFVWYYENGAIFQTCNYVNGLLDGAYKEFYPSGAKKSCVSYAMGDRNGCEYSWDENGKASVYKDNSENCPCAMFANENLAQPNNGNINKAVYVTPAVSFIGHFNNDMPAGDYQLFDNNVYYKAQGLEITAIAVQDIDQNPIVDSKIKLGQPLFLKLKIKRLDGKSGRFKFLLANHVEDTDGVVYSSESLVRAIDNEDSWISIAGGIRRELTYSDSKETYMSFKIKDKNSDAIIQGFIKFFVVQ